MRDGFLLVDKPAGRTSHDVVAAVRRIAGLKKVGHAGTLDPMATGLVIVALGRCTRLLRFAQDQPKVYEAVARFGVATDTLDAEGTVIEKSPLPVSVEDVESVLPHFRGEIAQVPPMVSALKHQGRRLYELAREGKVVERAPRQVTIYELDLTGFEPGDYPEVAFRVRCSSGTYIRSLADDIARALEGRAHLTALRRTESGGHRVVQAWTLEQLESDFNRALLAPVDALPELAAVVIDRDTATAVSHGRKLDATELGIDHDAPVRIVFEDRLVAVYRREGTIARPEVVLT